MYTTTAREQGGHSGVCGAVLTLTLLATMIVINNRYYAFDDAFMLEIAGKQLSGRLRKDLDDIARASNSPPPWAPLCCTNTELGTRHPYTHIPSSHSQPPHTVSPSLSPALSV